MIDQLEMRRDTLFKDAVLSEAEARSMEIIAEANQRRDAEMRSAYAACEEADHDLIAKQLARDSDREYSLAAQAARRDLLRFRAEKVDELFAEIEARLRDFTHSEEYPGWLAAKIIACGCAGQDAPTVLLRREDLGHAEALRAALPGCTVEGTDDIHIGGARLRAGRQLHDVTLDAALAAEKEAFTRQSGLIIE